MGSLGVQVLVFGFISLIIYAIVKYYRLQCRVNKIPGPRSYWLVGNAHQFEDEPTPWFEQSCGAANWLYSISGIRMFRIWLSVFPFLVVFGADEAEAVLSSTKHVNKGMEYKMLQPWMGLGLLTTYGERWRTRRKLLTPTFHADILKDFVKTFNQQARILVQKLKPLANGKSFDIYHNITLCALDIICDTAMGKNINAQNNEDSDYVKCTYRINDMIHDRQRKPWFWPDWIYWHFGKGKDFNYCLDVVHNFAQNVIDERMAEVKASGGIQNIINKATKAGGKHRLVFLDMLIEMVESGKMPKEDIRQEVDTFMFGGHDTTATSMNWTLFMLGHHPDVQAKVQQELDSIFEDNPDRDVTFEDFSKMKYLEMVLKEVMRIYPSIPFFSRQLAEDMKCVGYTVPKECEVMIWSYLIHRDPRYWPDPEIFDPERFSPDNSNGRHPYAFIPFSAGPRNCLGQKFAFMEEKTIIAWLLRKYNIKSTHRRDQVQMKPQIILRPVCGIHLQLTPRIPEVSRAVA